jgi:hypothetical protein
MTSANSSTDVNTQKGTQVERNLSSEQGTKTGLVITEETITPEKAIEYLSLNIENNRSVREWKANKYAEAMANGRWLQTSATIRFDTNGKLIDGQHRLQAIIRYGKPVKMMVSRGERPESIHVVDTQTSRNPRDSLVVAGLAGRGESSQVAGLANVMIGWEYGSFIHSMSEMATSDRLSNDEMIEYVQLHGDRIKEALDVANSVLRSLPLNRSGIAMAYLVLKEVDAAAAEEFFMRLSEGILEGQSDPLVGLVRKANAERLLPQRRNAPGTTLYLIIRTWNAWREGSGPVKYLMGSPVGGWTAIPRPI